MLALERAVVKTWHLKNAA